MVESVKVIESTKIFRSPLLNNLKIFNNLKPLKLDTKPGPSPTAEIYSSTKDMTTIRKSKRLKLSLKYILVPIAIILRTTSAVKMAVKIKLKTLKVSSTQSG